ncbi:MAG TPA: YcaO-like family protein [Abditibacterium sp.]
MSIYRDASAHSLQPYRAALTGQGRAFEFALSPFDHLDLPLWSVALIGNDGALSDGFGYGATLEAAQTSAWGECVEWHFAREALRQIPRRIASFDLLGESALDPRTLCLHAGSQYLPSDEREWVPVTRWRDGAPFWAPIEFIAPRAADIAPGARAEDFLVIPITNGLGAGPDLAHAVAHGTLELLQRDGNNVSYRALDQGVRVELDDVRDPQTRQLLDFLEAQNIEVMVKVAALDFGLCNLYVVGYDRDLERAFEPIALSACGESVHPDREWALGKALREWAMARARKVFNHGGLQRVRAATPPGYLDAFGPAAMRSEDERALREMRGWMKKSHGQFFDMLRDPIFETRRTVRFSDLPQTPAADSASLLKLLQERLSAENLDIYFADFSPPGEGLKVVKALVPGLEVETMTYERIGARNLKRLLERNSPLVGLGEKAGAKPIILPNGGAAWFDSAEKDRLMGALYPLYREPGRHVIGLLGESD